MPRIEYFPPQKSLFLQGPASGAPGETLRLSVEALEIAPGFTGSLEVTAPDGSVQVLSMEFEQLRLSFDLPLDQAGTYRIRPVSHPGNILRVLVQ